MKENTSCYFEKNIDLFRKIIASLTCIEEKTSDEYTKKTSTIYKKDLIDQYQLYLNHKDVDKINFKYSEKDIVDFSNECYDKIDIFEFAEDLEFGFSELVELVLEERELKKNI